jgi:hypothetical protein
VHVAAVVDEHGRVLDSVQVAAGELEQLLAWIADQPRPRQVAVEGARGYGWALTLRLLEIGESVVDVPAQLTADGRRTSRSRGKDDLSDAVIVARVAMREPGLQRPAPEHLDTDLKLLVDARDQGLPSHLPRGGAHKGFVSPATSGAVIGQWPITRCRSSLPTRP